MNTELFLVDTGPLVAVMAPSDPAHKRCVAQIQEVRWPLLTCWPVLTEAVYLLRTRPDLAKALLERTQSGSLAILPLDASDVPAILAIGDKYADQKFDLADACLMHLAEREDIRQVFTLDRRHFGVYRRPSGNALSLVPANG